MTGSVRTKLRSAHRWVSLVLGLPIALVAASGAAVDYWFAVDALAAPAFYQARESGPPVPFDRVAGAAHRAVPGGRIENIFLNQDGRVAIVSLTGPWGDRLRDVAVDRASGAVLAQRWQDEALINQLYAFHTRLLLGEGGRWIVLALAIVFVGLLASGLALWWPSRSRWRAALSWRLSRSRLLPDLHAKVGVYGVALMAVAGVTAAILLWPSADRFRPERPKGIEPSAGQTLQAMIEVAASEEPGWQPVNILKPGDQTEPMRIILWRPAGLVRSEAIQMVAVRRETLAVARLPLDDQHATARALHNGRLGGEVGRLALALAALLPSLLWISGIVHWCRARKSA